MVNLHRIKQSLSFRLTIIGLLSLVLLIPAHMIQSLIIERQDRRDNAIKEVSQKWGGSQILTGPILSIPFRDTSETKYIHFLPDELMIKASINPDIRYRGIYEVALYNAQLQIEGSFSIAGVERLGIPADRLIWNDAFIAIGISDMKGIKNLIKIKWNQKEYDATPSIQSTDILASGISIKPGFDKNFNDKFKFSSAINLNGSSSLMFSPIGKITQVDISSTWQNPSFTGNFLPETYDVLSNGFKAKWMIFHLNRNYPQYWIGDQYNPANSNFGVNLYIPVDEYQKTMRMSKYAIMFIALTFLSFFLIELLNRKVIHPIQYILIGFALLVFYTLLLSFSEHVAFKYAYLIASLGIVTLITAYTKTVLKSNLQTIIIAALLTVLYALLYVVLQLQDFALLMGSIGLFIILAIVMYITRSIDWFSIVTTQEKPDKSLK
ncbi:cell envelope integrity protein CreD [candidate division KSB1 bacterium]|nr:cell envelope integrity protein CreD [candidate division KSB1 bacterium]